MLSRRLALTLALCALFTVPAAAADPIRVGVLGLDNYQCVEYAVMFNVPKSEKVLARLDPVARQDAEQAMQDFAGLKVTAALPIGSPDIPESVENQPKWIEQIQRPGVKIVSTVDELLAESDCVMIFSLDGRQHLEQARKVLTAKKPLFIGRPMAASLADVKEIFRLAQENKTPVWSASQHRYSPGFYGMRNHPEVGKVLGVDVYGGCPTEPHHPELYWHALHCIETLYTIMGPGCLNVRCISTPYAEEIVGVWSDGRVGTFRGIKQGKLKYSATVFGDLGVSTAGIYGHGVPVKGVVPTTDRYMGYEGIGREMAKFFKTGKPPVSPEETIEIFTFMDAAHESKAKNGAPIEIKVTK
jgi:predicted dehydrogenase